MDVKHGITKRLPLLLLATTAALALAACGADSDPESDAAEATSSQAPETESASPSPSPSPSPTEAVFPEAADGDDFDACFDGECEVLLTGPVDIAVDPDISGYDTVQVTSVEGGYVSVTPSPDSMAISMSFDMSGSANMNGLLMAPMAIEADRAVVTLSITG
ncbi:hypothetical protein [Glycomyces buryatensis]|uniref:Uncharacterized protein n=1 Tax=Glycomyces buryatensis TaxID=2570927 RepID=A0A4S8PRR1_9ACTN|nr:hypothetical protein [Glycomyces buryatensis]THV32911.1 hypothetical protein FAB82_26785 [Glycomyces buryatensis]